MSEDDPKQPTLLCFPASRSLYIRVGSLYALTDDRLLRRELKAHAPWIPVVRETEDGNTKRISTAVLIERHAARVDRVNYSMVAPGDRWAPNARGGGELDIACARLDDGLDPRADADVAEWLKRLVPPDDLPQLLDWLATCHLLGRPTVALGLIGPPGTGKSMLAAAVAREFGTQVTDFSAICNSAFNGHLRDAPIVVADEGLGNGRRNAGYVRSLTTVGRRTINEKYKPQTTLTGYPRLIVTMNNPDGLALGDSTTAHDEEALAQRFYVVRVSEDAGDWLREKGGRTFTADWVSNGGRPGRLVNHIRHLQLTRPVSDSGGRFLVSGGGGWAGLAAERDGPANRVLLAIAAIATRDDHPAREDHCIAVSTKAVRLMVANQNPNADTLNSTVVGRQLSHLSGKNKCRVTNGRYREWKWLVPASPVVTAADAAGVGDDELLRKLAGLQAEPR